MTDREIVNKLIARDPVVTHWFLYLKCRPLFLSLIKKLFDYPVNYEEFVDEVVIFLLEKDEYRLRQFDYNSSLLIWLRTCLIRHFIRNGKFMIADKSKDSTFHQEQEITNPITSISAKLDMEFLLSELEKTNERYAYVIRRVMLEDADSKEVALELNILPSNLYNLKRRAIEELSSIALGLKTKKRSQKNGQGI